MDARGRGSLQGAGLHVGFLLLLVFAASTFAMDAKFRGGVIMSRRRPGFNHMVSPLLMTLLTLCLAGVGYFNDCHTINLFCILVNEAQHQEYYYDHAPGNEVAIGIQHLG